MNYTIAKPKSTLWEKICYGLGGIGSNYVWTFMSLYITMYYTNSVGIAATAAGTMMLLCRLLDGLSDILCAWVFKKVNMKLGKIRPWFLIAAPLLGISLIACFNVPVNLTEGGKLAYVYITYAFTAAVSYTIFNLAFGSILPLMSYDDQDRVTISSMGMFFIMGGVMIMSYLTPVLLGIWGGTAAPGAWSKVSIVYAIIATVFVAFMGIFIKEKEAPKELVEAQTEQMRQAGQKKLGFGKVLKMVLSNKYTWILLLMFTAYYLFSGAAGINAYYFMYIHGDFELMNYGTCSLISNIGNMAGLLLGPVLMKYLDRKKVLVSGAVLSLAASAVMLFTARNLIAFYALQALKTFALAPLAGTIYVFVADLTDNIRKKHDIDCAEVVSMTSSIGTKVGMGVGSAMTGWALGWVGFEAAEAVQTVATQNGIIYVTLGIPAICTLICIACIILWNPEK